MGSKSYRQVGRQSVFKFSRCILPLRCPCFASCHVCHDPITVRRAQTYPLFTGFTQLARPSRCSRSTLATVCFCSSVSVITSGLCVCIGLQPFTRSIRGSSPTSCSGVWDPWSVEYQSCKLAMQLREYAPRNSETSSWMIGHSAATCVPGTHMFKLYSLMLGRLWKSSVDGRMKRKEWDRNSLHVCGSTPTRC